MKATNQFKLKAQEELLHLLGERFENNPGRHAGIPWSAVLKRLSAKPARLNSLARMEATGGEPDLIGIDPDSGDYLFCDCSAESPAGRRSLCYDRAAWEKRKENKPSGDALSTAAEMQIQLLNEDQYRYLQTLGEFDLKTSSWIATPPAIRNLGGALFCDRRYNTVFAYHNGAESYYASRGFRGILRV